MAKKVPIRRKLPKLGERDFKCNVGVNGSAQAKKVRECLESLGLDSKKLKDKKGEFVQWRGKRGLSGAQSQDNCVNELASCEQVKKKLAQGVPI